MEKRIPMRAEWLLLLGAALISACATPGDVGGASTYSTAPAQPTPGGATGPYTLSGVLTVRTTSGTAPVANAGIGGYVIMSNGNNYGMTSVSTDADGRYQFSNVPSGVVVLYAGAPHAYVPCAAIGTVIGANGVKDIELVVSPVKVRSK